VTSQKTVAVMRFDPRAREGATVRLGRERLPVYVSIHAPVRARHEAIPQSVDAPKFRSTRP